MKCCINGRNYSRLLLLSTKIFKFEIQKCSQSLCGHKPYILMLGHIYIYNLDQNITGYDNVATYIEYI